MTMRQIKPLSSDLVECQMAKDKFAKQLCYASMMNYLLCCDHSTQWLDSDPDTDFAIFDSNYSKFYRVKIMTRATVLKDCPDNVYIAFPKDGNDPCKHWVIVNNNKMLHNWEDAQEAIDDIFYLREASTYAPNKEKLEPEDIAWKRGALSEEKWIDCINWSIIPPLNLQYEYSPRGAVVDIID